MKVSKYLRACRDLGLSSYVELAKYEHEVFPGEFFYRYEAGVWLGEGPQALRLSDKDYPHAESPERACASAFAELGRIQRRLARRSLREALMSRLEDL